MLPAENQELNLCACCAHRFEITDAFCNHCGFPLQGTKPEQDHYIANRITKEVNLIDLNRKIVAASNSLYWIVGIITVSSIISYFTIEPAYQFSFLITAVILVGSFLSFAVWSKTKPTTALISGLALYVIVQLLNFIGQPSSLFSGIVFKAMIVGYLIKGVIAVLEVEKIKKELNIK